MSFLRSCELCGVKKLNYVSCEECEKVFYCSERHQKAHWDLHKGKCQPTCIEESAPHLGRYFIAGRDLKAGDIIFTEKPISVGPRAYPRPVCLGCHSSIEDMGYSRCPQCFWPMCSEECCTSELHAKECPILARDTKKQGIPINLSPSNKYDVILTLRCLLLKDNRKSWAKLRDMASHADYYEGDQDLHNITINYIKNVLKFEADLKTIQHARGAIMTNCFEWTNKDKVSLRGVYPKLARINHSCVPNVTLSVDISGTMYIRAAVDIDYKSPLYVTYSGTTQPIWERKEYLNKIHYFDCNCTRCADPTELGLYYSSPKCDHCRNKFLIPNTWLENTDWTCEGCQREFSDYCMMSEYYQWMQRFDSQDTFIQCHPRGVRNIINRVEQAFHCTHHVWVMAAETGIRTLEETNSKESFALRAKLWEKLIKVYDVVEPGMTLRRGVALYELAVCKFNTTQYEMSADMLTEHYYKVYLREALKYVKDAIEILRLEPAKSHEIHWHKTALRMVDVILDLIAERERKSKNSENSQGVVTKKIDNNNKYKLFMKDMISDFAEKEKKSTSNNNAKQSDTEDNESVKNAEVRSRTPESESGMSSSSEAEDNTIQNNVEVRSRTPESESGISLSSETNETEISEGELSDDAQSESPELHTTLDMKTQFNINDEEDIKAAIISQKG